jgi:hypothetical protein
MSEEDQDQVRRDTREQVNRKVDTSVFTWTVTILSTGMITIGGYLFTELAGERVARAELGAKLEAEKEKNTAVLISLEQIKGDMRLMRDQLERSSRVGR